MIGSLRAALPPLIVSRLALFLFAWWVRTQPGGTGPAFTPWACVNGWVVWDGPIYLSILEGYSRNPLDNGRWFLVFPWLSWLLGGLIPGTARTTIVLVAGILLNYLAMLGGLIGIHQLMLRKFDEKSARRALWLLCLYPFSYPFGAYYTESIFLATSVWAFLLLEREHWWGACWLAALAIWIRPPGLMLAVALCCELLSRFYTSQGRDWRRADWRCLAPLLLPVVSQLCLFSFQAVQFGDPLFWAGGHKQDAIFLHKDPWGDLQQAWHFQGNLVLTGHLACLIGSLAVLPWVFRTWGPGYALVGLSLLVPATLTLQSVGRYAAVAFPTFMVLGQRLRQPWLLVLLLLVFSLGLFHYTRLFVTQTACF